MAKWRLRMSAAGVVLGAGVAMVMIKLRIPERLWSWFLIKVVSGYLKHARHR